MHWILIVLYVIIILIVIIWLFGVIWLWIYSNPSGKESSDFTDSEKKSVITCTNLGNRGDMGNQFFQMACVIAAAKRSKAKWVIPKIFDSLPIRELLELPRDKIYDIKCSSFYREYDNYEKIIAPRDGAYYDIRGYRQSYLYFHDHENDIKEIFKINPTLDDKVKKELPEKFICIHIRMGDYIKTKHKIPFMEEFEKCAIEYYKKSLNYIDSIIKNKDESPKEYKVIVATDSPKEVIKFLSEIDPRAELTKMIDGVKPKFSDFLYIYNANHIVMSNSTYSWWASFLNKKTNKIVIAPDPWWDPKGFLGRAVRLTSHHLHHPNWYLANSKSGEIVKIPGIFTNKNMSYRDTDEKKTDAETLNIIRVFRGMFV